MKISPIKPIAYTSDKDERHDAEEKRIMILMRLLSEMDVPQSRVQFLKLKNQRESIVTWLNVNLPIYNSHHRNFKQAQNLITLLLRGFDRP